MDRRALLAAVAGGALAAGCLDRSIVGDSDDDWPAAWDEDDAVPDGECGPADRPLSSRLVSSGGDARCPEGARPPFVVANEREEEISVSVSLSPSDGSARTKRYDLDAGESERDGRVKADESYAVSVAVEGENEETVTWEGRSCYRHAVVLTEAGVEAGYVRPLDGPGDGQHDCYAGDAADLLVTNRGPSRTVAVRVEDRCEGTALTEVLEVPSEETVYADAELVNGGSFVVSADAKDGGSSSTKFDRECWGVSARVEEDGSVRFVPVRVD